MDDKLLPKLENEMLTPLSFNEKPTSANKANIACIKCVKCERFFVFPDDKDDYLAHIFLEHRLVIADVEDIAILEEYLRYWQSEFEAHDFEEYCTTMLLDQLPDGKPAKNEKYYLLSDILPKDYELRKKLVQQSLENVLAQHQFERTDRNFSKECLYCRDVITGLRAQYLEHLFNNHFLKLGKQENLVFVDELIEKVQQNFKNLICLFCEKTFKDRPTLKEHMRKKMHKRINPDNRAYDKYFLIHYQNKGQPKQQSPKKFNFKRRNMSSNKNQGETVPTTQEKTDEKHLRHSESKFDRRFGDNDEDDNDSDWSDWNGEQLTQLNCLFCKQTEVNFTGLKQHMCREHQLDFDNETKNLSFYQKIKVVNYVRRQLRLLRCVTCDQRFENLEKLLEHMIHESHFSLGTQKQWDKPEYFFPTYEDDSLLCVLDDNPNDDNLNDVRIISEDTMVKINKDAEQLSLEKFDFSEFGI